MSELRQSLDDYVLQTTDKIRYGDTDRQGHVNNAVFATFLETGRAEILYDFMAPLADAGCMFVIANLNIDYLSEMRWPGTAVIGTRIASVGRSSIKIEQGIFQEDRCTAVAATTIVQVDGKTGKSCRLSEKSKRYLLSLRNGP